MLARGSARVQEALGVAHRSVGRLLRAILEDGIVDTEEMSALKAGESSRPSPSPSPGAPAPAPLHPNPTGIAAVGTHVGVEKWLERYETTCGKRDPTLRQRWGAWRPTWAPR
jgi:hypothetical protein